MLFQHFIMQAISTSLHNDTTDKQVYVYHLV